MSEDRIKHKDLWKRLNNIKRQREWLDAGDKLGFLICTSAGGTSHSTIRDKKYPITDKNGLVTTVQANLYKEANERIFKQFLDFGVEEEALWRALEML